MEKMKTESQSFIFSIVLHSLLLLFFIGQKVFTPQLKPMVIEPTLRVDLVGLPDLTKNEMPEALLRNAPKEIPAPVPEKIKEAEPPKLIEKAEMSIPDKKIPPPKKGIPEKTVPLKNQISNALNRIKSIESLKMEQEASERDTQNATLIKGNRISKGSSLSGAAKEALEVSYFEKVKDALNDNWALPPWLARLPLSAQVLIQIDAEGHVLSSRFIKSSGNSQFDQMVKTTIQETIPFPRPPKNLLSQISEKGFVLGFPL